MLALHVIHIYTSFYISLINYLPLPWHALEGHGKVLGLDMLRECFNSKTSSLPKGTEVLEGFST